MVKPHQTLAQGLLVILFSLTLSACGGGSSSSGSGSVAPPPPAEPNNTSVADGVNGPLDEVQTPVSESVFGQIIAGAEGTPLEGTLDCIRQAVVIDTLDILDSVALALSEAASTQDPAVFEAASGNIQFSLDELSKDLPGALGVLTGEDCNGSGTPGSNPLADTPLAPLGDALAPVLAQLSTNESGNGQDADLYSLALLSNQLATAFQSGMSQLPAEITGAPFLGGALQTLSTTLTDIDTTLYWFSRYNGDAAATALEAALNRALTNTLTTIVPLTMLEAQAGQPGVLSTPIAQGIDQLTSALGTNLLSVALPELASAMNNELAPVLDPIENTLLPAILLAAYSGLGDSEGTDPISLLLGTVSSGLAGGGSGSGGGPTGTPLDLLLGPIINITGGASACPFQDTPLASGCSLFTLLP